MDGPLALSRDFCRMVALKTSPKKWEVVSWRHYVNHWIHLENQQLITSGFDLSDNIDLESSYDPLSGTFKALDKTALVEVTRKGEDYLKWHQENEIKNWDLYDGPCALQEVINLIRTWSGHLSYSGWYYLDLYDLDNQKLTERGMDLCRRVVAQNPLEFLYNSNWTKISEGKYLPLVLELIEPDEWAYLISKLMPEEQETWAKILRTYQRI